MKKLFTIKRSARVTASALKTGVALLLALALASSLWFASSPNARGAQMTPAEMIQHKLPVNMTIATASDPQLLDAVCKAIKQWPKEAALIVRTAAGARQSLRSNILCMAIRCAREDKAGIDCTWALDIVREWIKADPSLANQLTESIAQCAPECRDALQNLGSGAGEGEGAFGNPPSNINAPPGSTGGGAGGNTCIVCHNGQEVQIACSDLQSYLRSHPGDTAGPCQPTPVTNP